MKMIRVAFFTLILSLFALNMPVAQTWETVYETDFSSDPFLNGWITNNSGRYYWDSGSQTLFTDNYTNSGDWATTDINYHGESFRLTFDVLPLRNPGETGDVDIGLFGPTRVSNSSTEERLFVMFGGYGPPVIYIEGHNSGGEAIWSGPGTGLMLNGAWHHVEVTYDSEAMVVSLEVTRDDGPVLSWQTAMNYGFSGDLLYLGVSMAGEWVTGDRHEIAYIDNITFSIATTEPIEVWYKSPCNPIWSALANDSYPTVVQLAQGYIMYLDRYFPPQQIEYMTSVDGVSWTNEGALIIPGQNDQFNWHDVSISQVFLNQLTGEYWMYYGANDGIQWRELALAISSDGLNWTDEGEVFRISESGNWDSYSVGDPKVIYDQDASLYYMLYVGGNGSSNHIGLASSPDGINWTRSGSSPLIPMGTGSDFDAGGIHHIGAFYQENGNFYCYYSCRNSSHVWSIGKAEGNDPTMWVKKGQVLLATEPWESGNIIYAYLCEINGLKTMYYQSWPSYKFGIAQIEDMGTDCIVSAFGSICASVNIVGDPASPTQGITITVIDENNDPVGDPLQTNENGESFFDSLNVGEYSVMIVTPLGYSVSPSETQTNIAVAGGECTTVDFIFTPTIVTNDCRTIGYWKHQFNVYTSGRGNAQEGYADLEAYLNLVHQHFDVLGIYVDLDNFDFEDAKDVLTVRGGSLMTERAKQQLFALLLNFASGRIGNETVVSDDGQVAAEAVTLAAALINDGDPVNDELAKDICDLINNGQMVEAGIIPESPIRYKFEPGSLPQIFSMGQNFPNPFNAQTTIEYVLPKSARVTVEVYNLLGRKVESLVNQHQQAGYHQTTWDASEVSSGVYFYRIQAREFIEIRKMLLLK